jgi:hypothetical protein
MAERSPSGQVTHRIQLLLQTGTSTTTYSYPVEYPLTPKSQAWQYRHLFGQEPLMPAAAEPLPSR